MSESPKSGSERALKRLWNKARRREATAPSETRLRLSRMKHPKVAVSTTVDQVTGAHKYVILGLICSESTAGCDAALQARVYDAVNRNDIPFIDNDLGNGRRELTWWGDPIEHYEDPSNMTTTNVTVDGHTFHPGTVTHQVFFRDGSLYYQVTGTGTGFSPSFNNAVGVFLFRPGVRRIVLDYGMP